MSFSFRDKPRLSERLRGKSGDDLINELKNHLDQERKMFFDTAPNWGSVHPSGSFSSRTGFPFDDDMMPRSGRQDIRAHLDDLAQRHPEFADQLRCPPWGGEMSGSPSHTGTWRRGSNEGEPHTQARSSSSGSNVASEPATSSPKPEDNRGRNPFPQQGEPGRDDSGNRGQRSMSAPPDARNQQTPEPQNQPQQTPQPPRFVSRVNITPGKPPVAPQKPQSPQQSSSNVRHIPIFVEGRDEPVLPKNLVSEDPPPEQVFSQRIPPQPQQTFSKPQTFTSHHQFQPQQRFYSPPQPTRTEYTRPQQNVPQSKPETIFSQQNAAPSMQQPTTQPPKETSKPSQPKPQQPKPQPQPLPNDPIHRVQAVQKDVENLQRMVENFSGNSRKDKQYIYLDEMLTRNLLKLDDIDTEGKENVRQARREAIRSIQKCISILESKVPGPEEKNEGVSEEIGGTQSVESGDTTEQTEETPAEKMEAQTVEPESEVQENAGEKLEPGVKETECIEKMDVEHSVPPLQQSETESTQVETKDESQLLAAVTETNKDENIECKGETADTQLTMDVVESQTPVNEATNQVKSEKPLEKGDKSDMEVEPPVSGQTDIVQMEAEALPQKDVTVKADTEPQKESDVKDPHLLQIAKETEVPENGVSSAPGISEETEPKTADDATAMQVEPIPTGSEVTNPPRTEELSEIQKESAKENVSSEQTSDKDSKEVDTKKKKTGKKVKSPSKKPPKQGTSSKTDSSEEAQKS